MKEDYRGWEKDGISVLVIEVSECVVDYERAR